MRMKLSFIFFSVLITSPLAGAQQVVDTPQATSFINGTLLAEVTPQGQKVTAVALEYEGDILSGTDLRQIYQVQTSLDNQEKQSRSVIRAYVNNQPATACQPHVGKFVIIELDDRDKNAGLYALNVENELPMKFRTKAKDGSIGETEKVQANRVPHYYHERLTYHIQQTGYLKLSDGRTLDKQQISRSTVKNNVKTAFIDDFVSGQISLSDPENKLHYRIYKPKIEPNKQYPLTIFLHGSGQFGNDNLAQLLSSKGAIATLQYESGFVLAPQYDSVFDPFDDVRKGQPGGIHWQTANRRELLFKMIDETLAANPNIDKTRIYLIGLSRGAEGSINLLLKRPHFFAAALLLSGREAYTTEWIDGNATQENLAPIKNVPMWFFHSKEDKVSPVKGSRINYQILSHALRATQVKYTEFSVEQAGDNGIINNNAHNTWDTVFNSPEVMTWLLNQKNRTVGD